LPSTRSSSSASEGRGRAVRYIAFVLIVLAVPLSIVIRRAVNSNERVDPLHSGPAPAFSLQSLDGETVSLADFQGGPVVVNFWGAWCEQCKLQLPLLAEMKRRFPAVPIVGILYQEDPEVGRAAAAHGDATWPTLVDPGGQVAAAYGVASAPATFFIRADGTIAADLVGPVSTGILQKGYLRIAPGSTPSTSR
jgi:cytochrome c biogenesis protein CcmG, thiol:disulfide interchange protein DsbE